MKQKWTPRQQLGQKYHRINIHCLTMAGQYGTWIRSHSTHWETKVIKGSSRRDTQKKKLLLHNFPWAPQRQPLSSPSPPTVLNSRPPPPLIFTLMLGKMIARLLKIRLSSKQPRLWWEGQRTLGASVCQIPQGSIWGLLLLNNVNAMCEEHIFSWWKIQRHADGGGHARIYCDAEWDDEKGAGTGLKWRHEGGGLCVCSRWIFLMNKGIYDEFYEEGL